MQKQSTTSPQRLMRCADTRRVFSNLADEPHSDAEMTGQTWQPKRSLCSMVCSPGRASLC